MPATQTPAATSTTRTIAPIYSDVDLAAHDVCCDAKHALIVAGSITLLAPEADGTNSLSTYKHNEIAAVLGSIPRGAMLRISFQAAAPRSADLVLIALDAAGFTLEAVSRHENTPIGRPGKEKNMRDGMLAFRAPKTIDAELAAFARNVAHIAAGC